MINTQQQRQRRQSNQTNQDGIQTLLNQVQNIEKIGIKSKKSTSTKSSSKGTGTDAKGKIKLYNVGRYEEPSSSPSLSLRTSFKSLFSSRSFRCETESSSGGSTVEVKQQSSHTLRDVNVNSSFNRSNSEPVPVSQRHEATTTNMQANTKDRGEPCNRSQSNQHLLRKNSIHGPPPKTRQPIRHDRGRQSLSPPRGRRRSTSHSRPTGLRRQSVSPARKADVPLVIKAKVYRPLSRDARGMSTKRDAKSSRGRGKEVVSTEREITWKNDSRGRRENGVRIEYEHHRYESSGSRELLSQRGRKKGVPHRGWDDRHDDRRGDVRIFMDKRQADRGRDVARNLRSPGPVVMPQKRSGFGRSDSQVNTDQRARSRGMCPPIVVVGYVLVHCLSH